MRITGDTILASSYEVQKSTPLDTRQWVQNLSDLTGVTFGSYYSGMTVSVYGDTASTANNGVYYFNGQNQTSLSSWVKLIDTTVIGNYLTLSGGTVSGNTVFLSGLTATTIFATTYLNLPATPYLNLSGGTVTVSYTHLTLPTIYSV